MDKIDISQIDKNFAITNDVNKSDVQYYSVHSSPFRIYGVFYKDGKFKRIDEDVAKSTSAGVFSLNTNTAGGRIRFCTDSEYVAIKVRYGNVGKMPHFSLWGTAAFDLYADCEYVNTFKLAENTLPYSNAVIDFPDKKMRSITINMPSYAEVEEVVVGLSENAKISESTDYMIETPIVFYGSSITQGGCSSRPGCIYQNVISRALDANYINLGFSGNAKGESTIRDYIKSLKMSAFVLDYDHNAPTIEHLKATHEQFYLAVRSEHPTLPIIICSRPKYTLTNDEKNRRAVVETTYKNALKRGENVYFLDGKTLMAECKNEGTVDNCHPNDLGFNSMAKPLIEVLKKALSIR